MAYPILNATDTEDMFTLLRYVNNVMHQLFFPVMLLVIGAISLIGSLLAGKPIYKAITYTGFICSVLGIILSLMNFLSFNYMYFCFFLTAIGIILTRFAEAPS